MSSPALSLQRGNLYSSWPPLQSAASTPGRAEPTPAGRRNQNITSLHPPILIFIAILPVQSEHHSPGSLFLWEQLPSADRSTRTCGTLYRTGWGRSNLWPLRSPAGKEKNENRVQSAFWLRAGSDSERLPGWMCGWRTAEAWDTQLSWGRAPQTCQPGCPEILLPGQWFPLRWTYIPTTGRTERATWQRKRKDGWFRS